MGKGAWAQQKAPEEVIVDGEAPTRKSGSPGSMAEASDQARSTVTMAAVFLHRKEETRTGSVQEGRACNTDHLTEVGEDRNSQARKSDGEVCSGGNNQAASSSSSLPESSRDHFQELEERMGYALTLHTRMNGDLFFCGHGEVGMGGG